MGWSPKHLNASERIQTRPCPNASEIVQNRPGTSKSQRKLEKNFAKSSSIEAKLSFLGGGSDLNARMQVEEAKNIEKQLKIENKMQSIKETS